MFRSLIVSILTVAAAVLPVMAQQDQPVRPISSVEKKIIEIGTTDNHVMDHLDVLTNRIGGRLIGSASYEEAVKWLLAEYDKLGIKAWTEVAGTLPVGFDRGPWSGRMYGDGIAMDLHFVTPSYTSGTHGLQRGHVVMEPKTQAQFERMRHKLKGAWVLIGGKSDGFPVNKTAKGDSIREAAKAENAAISERNDANRRRNWEEGTSIPMEPLKEVPALFYREMVDAGVLGFIQSADVPLRALYDRQMLNDTIHPASFDSIPWQVEVKLDHKQYDRIAELVNERHDIIIELDVRNHFRHGPVEYSSVIAEIPGTEFPDEYVIVSGHLDAYDVATGGVDCGTGIGPMLEAARLLALSGAKPRRTIRFVAFAGEEFGLLGAEAYAKAHADELPRISMLLNRDGGPTPAVGMRVSEAMKHDIEIATAAASCVNPEYPFEITVAEPRKRPTSTGGTDASVFALKGVPTYGFVNRDFKGYDFDYGEIWHTERDIFNKEIPEYQEFTSVVTALTALGIANLDNLLSREGMYLDESAAPADSKKKKSSKKK